LAAAVLLLPACQVKVDVRVSTTAAGAGEVRVTAALDEEAAAQTGTLALDDLKQAGWTVTATDSKNGGRVYTATHPFGSPEELAAVLRQVGPFENVHLATDRSLLKTKTRFSGTLDLTPGLAVFSDDGVRAALGGTGIGLDPAAVKDATGVDVNSIADIGVTVAVPGQTVTTKATIGQPVTLEASASHYNTSTIVYVVIAGVSALAALVLVVSGRRWRSA
jgi:hypothetical protein